MPKASSTAFPPLSFDAKDSTRPMIIQFTTISFIKSPIASESSGVYACISRSTMVVKDAITIIKTGIRRSVGMSLRNILIISSLITITKVIATPIPMPFRTFVVTAKDEQSPIIKTNKGLFWISPFVNIRMFFILYLLLILRRVFFGSLCSGL